MSHHTPEEMAKHIRIYLWVFLALAVLTAVTVWASYLQVSHTMHIIIALTIASIKASLVGAYFMHLITEKKLIGATLIFTGFLLVFLIVYIYLADKTKGPLVPNFW